MTEVPTGDANRDSAPPPPAFIQRYPGAPPEPNPALQQAPGSPYAQTAPYPAPPHAQTAQYPGGPMQYPYPQPYAAAPDSRPKTLATVALATALAGVVAVLVPIISVVAGLILLAAIVLGIVALASRRQGGKGFGVAAIVVAVVGGMTAWILSTVVFGLFGLADAWRDDAVVPSPLPSSETYVPPVDAEPTDGSDGMRGTIDSPYGYGELVPIWNAATGDPVWEISVGTPVDLTGELAAEDLFNPTPETGVYSAVPVTLTYIGDGTIDPWRDYEWVVETSWVTLGGAPLEEEYLLLPDGYLSALDLATMGPGQTVTFHSVVDAPLDAVGGVRTAIGFDYELYWAAPQ
ncbi:MULTISPECIES: hypothetical protein [unclassified Microbacterium]|uniref:hypothetical protein n=1 Tax=unclassified Microbacterium TaxID=2609290 RepID=UPI00214CF003|nr:MULTISPECIES: hypothetical protein [unclassified Microbacterium]MCR2809201.1 hypothetical protein [Microbacterium sp. zg.B185]WIM20348.1 hypothetical protein QNO12_05985 [Microbacterium sp. zg-B185]